MMTMATVPTQKVSTDSSQTISPKSRDDHPSIVAVITQEKQSMMPNQKEPLGKAESASENAKRVAGCQGKVGLLLFKTQQIQFLFGVYHSYNMHFLMHPGHYRARATSDSACHGRFS
jgi:hypothetical protein